MAIIGIDPGLTGAIAIISGAGFIVEDMPVMQNGSAAKVKNVVNGAELARLLRPHVGAIKVAYVEKVSTMPARRTVKGKVISQGMASQGSLMHSLGVIEGVLAALNIPVVLVQPTKWKNAYGLGNDKEASRAMAQRLFPDAPLGRKKDHGRAEALLIADYGRKARG